MWGQTVNIKLFICPNFKWLYCAHAYNTSDATPLVLNGFARFTKSMCCECGIQSGVQSDRLAAHRQRQLIYFIFGRYRSTIVILMNNSAFTCTVSAFVWVLVVGQTNFVVRRNANIVYCPVFKNDPETQRNASGYPFILEKTQDILEGSFWRIIYLFIYVARKNKTKQQLVLLKISGLHINTFILFGGNRIFKCVFGMWTCK